MNMPVEQNFDTAVSSIVDATASADAFATKEILVAWQTGTLSPFELV